MRLRPIVVVLAPVLLVVALTGCAEKETATISPATMKAVTCTDPAQLPLKTKGKLTVATDSPAYDPWFKDDKPSNGEGFESAVAYAVAGKLGFTKDQVTWVKQAFNNSYTPGPKTFDFDINQISITDARKQAVSFSAGYYQVAQGVVTLNKNAAKAKTLADLKKLKLGAQTATTSLTAVRDDVKPTQQPLVFSTNDQAKQALLNGQVDALVVDLPTAFYITSAEIDGSTITGQFAGSGKPEEFGLLSEKNSGLTLCLDKALTSLKEDGTLDAIQKKWLSDVVDVPVLK